MNPRRAPRCCSSLCRRRPCEPPNEEQKATRSGGPAGLIRPTRTHLVTRWPVYAMGKDVKVMRDGFVASLVALLCIDQSPSPAHGVKVLSVRPSPDPCVGVAVCILCVGVSTGDWGLLPRPPHPSLSLDFWVHDRRRLRHGGCSAARRSRSWCCPSVWLFVGAMDQVALEFLPAVALPPCWSTFRFQGKTHFPQGLCAHDLDLE